MVGTVSIRALGTTATAVLTDPAGLVLARSRLVRGLRALDLACSRFRTDSELARLNRSAGRPTPVGELLLTALEAALAVARMTGGLVDPTVGRAMRGNGYDRTFSRLPNGTLVPLLSPAGRYEEIELDHDAGTVLVPAGIELDLGASAKALAADRLAAEIAADSGAGVLVSLGGDLAIGGPPPSAGWVVGVDDDHATPAAAATARVAIRDGGLASSGIRVRRWRTAAGDYHHIVVPRTGRPARGPWSTVTVAGASCLEANAASTASIVLGSAAPDWLAARRLPARLARLDGGVVHVAGWPADEVAA